LLLISVTSVQKTRRDATRKRNVASSYSLKLPYCWYWFRRHGTRGSR